MSEGEAPIPHFGVVFFSHWNERPFPYLFYFAHPGIRYLGATHGDCVDPAPVRQDDPYVTTRFSGNMGRRQHKSVFTYDYATTGPSSALQRHDRFLCIRQGGLQF